MPENFPSMGETCGIEFEFESVSQNANFLSGWKKTHDASIETDAFILQNGITISRETDRRVLGLIPYSNCVLGVEVTSPILEIDDEETLNQIKQLTLYAQRYGEKEESERCGIHFHISLAYPNLTMLKNIIRLGRFFEALFFHVGGMGYEFRGIKNDSIYCRPITRVGPPCVSYKRSYAQVFNIDELLKTKTRNEFWYLYGDCQNHNVRYNPVRYTWLNLYPLCPYGQHRGTLEFRLFNKSLNPLYIYSALLLCKGFVELVLKETYGSLREKELVGENSIYNPYLEKKDIFDLLDKFLEFVTIEPKYANTLRKIIQLTPQFNLKEKFIYTHIRQGLNNYWINPSYEYQPSTINQSEIYKPEYVDIHVLRGEVS